MLTTISAHVPTQVSALTSGAAYSITNIGGNPIYVAVDPSGNSEGWYIANGRRLGLGETLVVSGYAAAYAYSPLGSSVVTVPYTPGLESADESRMIPTTIFGDSIAGSAPRSVLNANFEPNTTALANLSYAVSVGLGAAIIGVRAQGSSRLLIGDPGSSPHLQEQINQFLTARALGSIDALVQLCVVKSLTNTLNGAANLTNGQVDAVIDTYLSQTDRLEAVGCVVVHVIPSLRTDEANDTLRLQSYNQIKRARERLYALRPNGIFIDLWDVMQRTNSAQGGTPALVQTWNTGFTSDNIHPNSGGAGAAFVRAALAIRNHPVIAALRSRGVIIPSAGGSGIIQPLNAHGGTAGASHTLPLGGGTNWNRSGASDPTATQLAPDANGHPGTEIAFAGSVYLNFVATGLLTPGQWYAFSCTHEIVTTNTTAAQLSLRLFWGSGGNPRSSVFESIYWPTGWRRAAVLFKCPESAQGYGNPTVQFGSLAGSENCTVRVRDLQISPVDY